MYSCTRNILKYTDILINIQRKFELIPIKIGFLENWVETGHPKLKNPILIGISSNFLHNISTCICIRKNYKNGKFSPNHF